jgi:hypothetical protein
MILSALDPVNVGYTIREMVESVQPCNKAIQD